MFDTPTDFGGKGLHLRTSLTNWAQDAPHVIISCSCPFLAQNQTEMQWSPCAATLSGRDNMEVWRWWKFRMMRGHPTVVPSYRVYIIYILWKDDAMVLAFKLRGKPMKPGQLVTMSTFDVSNFCTSCDNGRVSVVEPDIKNPKGSKFQEISRGRSTTQTKKGTSLVLHILRGKLLRIVLDATANSMSYIELCSYLGNIRPRFYPEIIKDPHLVFVNLRPKDLYIKVKRNTEGRHPKSMPGLLQKLPSKSCILPPEEWPKPWLFAGDSQLYGLY